MSAHCQICGIELDVHEDWEPIYCQRCVIRDERFERALGTFIILGVIIIYILGDTIGLKFWEWNWP